MGLAKYAWSGYVLECPNCGIIFRSRQFWYGNADPAADASVVTTEVRHVWPGRGSNVLQGTENAARQLIGEEGKGKRERKKERKKERKRE